MDKQTIAYGCTLYAFNTGDGWELGVRDKEENIVAILEWPDGWGEKSSKELEQMGYSIE